MDPSSPVVPAVPTARTEPSVIERAPQPYVSVPRTVTMATISCAADDIPGLFTWLAEHGTKPAAPLAAFVGVKEVIVGAGMKLKPV